MSRSSFAKRFTILVGEPALQYKVRWCLTLPKDLLETGDLLVSDVTRRVEDLRFGGNFNRLKNLMARNDGVYISADVIGFGEQAKNQIKALMKHYAEISPGAPIIVGCASTSCKITYRLLEDPESAAMLSGVVLFGGGKYGPFLETPVFRNPEKWVPIYIGHGSKDGTNNGVTLELFFKAIKKAQPDYPIRYDLFVGGVHGTPIRMADWRMVINWMLDANEGGAGARTRSLISAGAFRIQKVPIVISGWWRSVRAGGVGRA